MSRRKKKKPREPLIYVGPNLPGNSLRSNTVIKGELPPVINRQIEECPEIKNLFIPVKDLVKVKKKLNQKGSREQKLYTRILEYVRGE